MIRIDKKKFLGVLGIFVFLFILAKPVSALTISISNLPTAIDRNQETEVDLYFSCAGCGDFSYIRSVFYPSGTNYFGFTQNNGGSWVGTVSDRSQYFIIAKTDLIDASWSGKIKVKPDSNDSAYIGPGEYLFKVGRYTSASDSSADWSNELAIKITGPTPAPTTSPTQVQSSAPDPTPAANPTPTKTPSPLPTKIPKKSATPSPTPDNTPDILGEAEIGPPASLSASPSITDNTENKNKFPILAVITIVIGLIFIGVACYVAFKH